VRAGQPALAIRLAAAIQIVIHEYMDYQRAYGSGAPL
jgi:hypothetical protein